MAAFLSYKLSGAPIPHQFWTAAADEWLERHFTRVRFFHLGMAVGGVFGTVATSIFWLLGVGR